MDPALVAVQPTAYGGRGAFAVADIPKDTLILAAVPFASVLYRKYRKEVCAECLAYAFDVNRNTWNIKHEPAGVWFCSSICCEAWIAQHGELDEIFHQAVERLTKMKKIAKIAGKAPVITQAIIDAAWRNPPQLSTALSELELDTVRFVISGVIWRNKHPQTWLDVLRLQDNELSYISGYPDGLASSLRIAVFVRDVVKHIALDFDVLGMVRQMLARDQGNVFGLFEVVGDSEMFGFAMYPSGSYFNHDCTPTIRKERRGLCMHFYTARDVRTGEELCISYIDIKDPVHQRQEDLFKDWYFRCLCQRCNLEALTV